MQFSLPQVPDENDNGIEAKTEKKPLSRQWALLAYATVLQPVPISHHFHDCKSVAGTAVFS